MRRFFGNFIYAAAMMIVAADVVSHILMKEGIMTMLLMYVQIILFCSWDEANKNDFE